MTINPRAKDAGAHPALKKAGSVTAATWLLGGSVGGGAPGMSGADFATGHELGEILVRVGMRKPYP